MFEELLDVNNCECGKNHSLVTRDYIIEKDAMAKLPALLKKLRVDRNPLAVFDGNTYKAAYGKLSQYLPNVDTLILQGDEVHPDEQQVEAITAACPGHSALLAVGSGVVNDLVRYVASKKRTPVVSVPTAASMDGYVSNSSAMSIKGAKITLPTVPPNAVVADLEIIAAAPKKLTTAGVGDMLSKYISLADWQVGALIAGEYYCPYVAQLEKKAVDLIIEQIDSISNGDIDGVGKLIEGLLLSGMAMQMVGMTRPASSFEHHFSHFLEVVPVDKNINVHALHGEKVGVATIIAAKYYPVFARQLKRIYEENLPNLFSAGRLKSLFSSYPTRIEDMIMDENETTITKELQVSLLEQNYDKVLEVADAVPKPEVLRATLERMGGMTSYRDIGMEPQQLRQIMKICCYIRNRFTMLRIVCDYGLFDFESMDD